DSPFGSLMEQTVRGETIDHHKIQVEYYRKIEDIKECDVLFICRNDAGMVRQIEKALKMRPALTVADFPAAVRDGVCIQFVTRNNKIRFKINLDAAKAAHLTMSARLLSLAETVSQ
ncbi:MAG: YfiR family protein, partial [Limisphaerales bacterium]